MKREAIYNVTACCHTPVEAGDEGDEVVCPWCGELSKVVEVSTWVDSRDDDEFGGDGRDD